MAAPDPRLGCKTQDILLGQGMRITAGCVDIWEPYLRSILRAGSFDTLISFTW